MAAITVRFYNVSGQTLYVRAVRRSDNKILDTSTNDFATSPTWSNTIPAVTEQTAVSKGLYTASITFPTGVHVCDLLVHNDNSSGSVPIDAFEFIADGTNGVELTLSSINTIVVAIDTLTKASGDGDLAAIKTITDALPGSIWTADNAKPRTRFGD